MTEKGYDLVGDIHGRAGSLLQPSDRYYLRVHSRPKTRQLSLQ